MTITSFNKQNLTALRAEIDAALAIVGAKHGISIKLGNGKFTDKNFNCRVEANVLGGKTLADVNLDKSHEEFDLYCRVFGLLPEHYGKVFTLNGKQIKIVGVNLRAPKMPINVYCVEDCKGYKISPEAAKRGLGI